MKVLLINTSEKTGGAAVACKRLMKALAKSGVEVKMLVRDKVTDDESVIPANSGWLAQKMNFGRFVWERLTILYNNKLSRNNLFAVSIANSGIPIANHPAVKEADILHLHWINQGFLSISEIEKLTKLGKPVVWTMHDMWPATGICHHAKECNHYEYGCGECFFLTKPSVTDLSAKVFRKKYNAFINSKINFTCVSKWLANKAALTSYIGKDKIRVIPNALNEDFFKEQKDIARQELGISPSQNVIVFGAFKLNDSIKGANYLFKSIDLLIQKKGYKKEDLLLILFGNIKDDSDFLKQIPCPYIHKGLVTNIDHLRTIYNAADCTTVPSLYETFGQTLIESMACGCPVVSFNNSGQTDIIDHLQNGYLAQYKSIEDFAEGINWILTNKNREEISENAIQKVLSSFSPEIVANKYIRLYREILTQN